MWIKKDWRKNILNDIFFIFVPFCVCLLWPSDWPSLYCVFKWLQKEIVHNVSCISLKLLPVLQMSYVFLFCFVFRINVKELHFISMSFLNIYFYVFFVSFFCGMLNVYALKNRNKISVKQQKKTFYLVRRWLVIFSIHSKWRDMEKYDVNATERHKQNLQTWKVNTKMHLKHNWNREVHRIFKPKFGCIK